LEKEFSMPILPFTTKPEDVVKLLKLIPTLEVPAHSVNTAYLKTLGFSQSSRAHLLDILQKLGFVSAGEEPSDIWKEYALGENRGQILAAAIKAVYPNLFAKVFCPYLEPDDDVIDYLRPKDEKVSARDLNFMLDTFRALCELADFQNDLGGEKPDGKALSPAGNPASVKVNPNLQLNIQVHIDPNTPDAKIDAIFKSMRKYLLEHEG
jgi:Family of unknown function (DUF5343)